MRILALETSTEFCSVALWQDGAVLEAGRLAGQSHSSLILPMVRSLLADAGVAMTDLDAIAFGAGPGSFTGVRIAVAVAQGLAFAHDTPVVPVTSLAALAEDRGAPRVLACLDARMGELYLGAYERSNGGWSAIIAPCLVRPDALPGAAGRFAGVGSGFARHGEALVAAYDLEAVDGNVHPQARAVAVLGAAAFAAGAGILADQAAPLYLRDKVALDVHEQAAARAAKAAA
jgi:tRNA threonylcarbamoyladenosine biosynthesis protein TsaB